MKVFGSLLDLKSRDDAILPHSRGLKSPNSFWTKVQGRYNATTFSSTKVTGSVLNKISRMIQSYHILEYRSHWIRSKHKFKLFRYTRYSQKTEHLEQPLHTNESQIYTPMFITWLKPSRGKQSMAPIQIATWSNLLCKRKKVTWASHNWSTSQGPSILFK